ncbi:YybH family protein [Terricaulis sp.]|uniref:YybH family protein n=1 Tax=Terricaulis sp. TaxID=2768686 RepID=UPI0037847C4C
MTKMLRAAAVCGLALLLAGPAAAQANMSLRAPAWAQPLLATDVTPTTGGRAVLAADGVDLTVRVTIQPTGGGVARVIRYDQRGDVGQIALRRFTGHPSTGWWLWGSDAPLVTTLSAADRTQVAALARSAAGVATTLAAESATTGNCDSGIQAYVEMVVGGRSQSQTRACVIESEPTGQLVLRLSQIAGSRSEEELAAAAVNELLAADRAFAAKAAADGVPAAFAAYAASDGMIVTSTEVANGQEEVVASYRDWPQGARLAWAPEAGRVSARGDMGWTWGNSTYTAPDGARRQGRYITVWKRDYDGNWRFAFDAPIR